MRLLERVLIDVIGRYVPDVDLQKLKVDLLHQRANLSSVNLAPEGHVAPTVFLAGLPFTLLAPSTLKSLDVWFDGGRLRADGSGLSLRLVHVPYKHCAGNTAVNDAFARAKRTALAEAERQATGIFGQLLNNLLPVLMHKVQFVMTDVHVSVEFGGKHFINVSVDRLQTTNVDYAPISKYDAGGVQIRDPRQRSKGAAPSIPSSSASSVDGLVAVAGDLAKDVVLEGVSLTLGRQPILSLVHCALKLRYRLGEYDVELCVNDPLKCVISKILTEALLALRREIGMWEIAAKYGRPRQSALEKPVEWWRFIVRMLMRSSGCGHLSADFGRTRLLRCVAYYNAHLERLSKGNRAKSSTVEICCELEDILDVETITFVRSRARNNVRTQTASRFAAEDWLGWMLIGHPGNSGKGDREMAKDIRDAVDSLEAAEGQGLDSMDGLLAGIGYSRNENVLSMKNPAAVPNDATSWTTAAAVLRVKSIVVSFVEEDDGLNLDVVIDNARLLFELDSGFSTLTLGASVDALAVTDGRVNYIRQVGVEQSKRSSLASTSQDKDESTVPREVAEGMSLNSKSSLPSAFKESSARLAPILVIELQAFPKSLDAEASLNVFIGSVAAHVDVASLSPILATYSRLQMAGCGIEDNVRYPDILPLLSSGEGVKTTTESSAGDSEHVGSILRSSTGTSSISLTSESFDRSTEVSEKPSSDWFKKLALSFQIEQFQLLLSSGLAVRDSNCLTRDAFVFDVSKVLCSCSPFNTDPGREFSAACTVVCRSCVMANDLGLDSCEDSEDLVDANDKDVESPVLFDNDGFIRILHESEPCLVADRLTLTVTNQSILEARCGDNACLHLRETELESTVHLAQKIVEELESELEVEDTRIVGPENATVTGFRKVFAPPFTPSAWNRFTLQPRHQSRSEDTVLIRLVGDALLLSASFEDNSFENNVVQPVVTVLMRELRVESGFESPGSLALFVRSVVAADAKGKADLDIASADGKTQLGLRILSQSLVTNIGTTQMQKTEVKLGKVELSSSADRVLSLSTALSKILHIFHGKRDRVQSQGLSPGPGAGVDERHPSLEKTPSSVVDANKLGGTALVQNSVQFFCTSVRAKIEVGDFVPTAFGTGLYFEKELGRWEGHLESIEMSEYSTSVRSETLCISSRKEASVNEPSYPRMRVSFGNGEVRFFLASMKLVVFKPSLERTISSIAVLVREAAMKLSELGEPAGRNARTNVAAHVSAPDTETSDLKWSINAKRVFLVLPQSNEGSLAVGLELGDISVASAAGRLEVGGRKIAVLSSSLASNSVKRNPTVVWNRIVPSLDIDVTHCSSSEVVIEGGLNPPRRHREEWKVELVSTPTILLSVEKARVVMTVVADNLLAASPKIGPSRTANEEAEEACGGLEVSSLSANRYDRTVVTVVAPGLAIQLFESFGSADGLVLRDLALLGVGSVRFFFDSVLETPLASFSRTQVTALVLDIESLRVHDRQGDVHESFRLALNIESSSDSASAADSRDFVPCLHLIFHEKRNGEGPAEAKVEARVSRPQILLQPKLFASIGNFFASCVESDHDELTSELDNVDVDEKGEIDAKRTYRKTSIVIVSPQVFIAETPLTSLSRGLELCADEIKLSLRQNWRGKLTKGTQVRARGLELSVSSPGSLALHSSRVSTEAMHRSDDPSGGQRIAALHLGCLSNDDTRKDVSRHSIICANEIAVSALKCWSLESDEPVVLLRMVTLQCRPPSVESSAFFVTIPTILFDATIRDLASLLTLFGRLHLPQNSKDHDESTASSFKSKTSPPIDVRLLDIECIIRIPQHRLRGPSVRFGGDGSSVLRVKSALDVFIRDGANLDSTLRVFAVRSYDGQSGIWDRRDVLEDCTVALAFCWTGSPVVPNVVVKSSGLRLNLSPLIVKTLCNLVYSMEAAFSEDAIGRRDVAEVLQSSEGNIWQSHLKLDLGLYFIEVFLLSEQLRVRATISDVRAQLLLPANAGEPHSEFKLYVGNLIVRNEALRSRGNEIRDWSILLTKAAEEAKVASQSWAQNLSPGVIDPLLLICDSSFASMPRSRLRSGRRTPLTDTVTAGNAKMNSSKFLSQQEEESSSKPLLKIVLRFGCDGEDEIVGAVLMTGLDISIDVDIVAELVAWAGMTIDSIATAKKLHRSLRRRPPSKSRTNSELKSNAIVEGLESARQTSRHGRIVIGTSGLRLSARAPSSVQSSVRTLSVRRVAEVVLGSDCVSDLTFVVPMRNVSFNFATSGDIASAITLEYKALALSRSTFGQVVRQSASVFSLARVGVLAYLRRADSPRRPKTQPENRRAEGLLEITDSGSAEWNHKLCICERVSMLDISSARRLRGQVRKHPEVIGMGGVADVNVVADGALTGASLFQTLIRTDSRLRALGDNYSFFALLDESKRLLVTDKHILIVNHEASTPFVERRLAISGIERYSVSTRNSNVLLVHFTAGGFRTRQYPSDMLSQFEARARAAVPLELTCSDKMKAESLSQWLPSARRPRHNLDLPDVDLDLPIVEEAL